MAKPNLLYVLVASVLIFFLVLTNQCATSAIQYGSSGLITHGNKLPVITPEKLNGEEKIIDMDKINYYHNLMAQKFEFAPPVKIVVIFQRPQFIVDYTPPQRRPMVEENLVRIFCDTLAMQLENTEFVRDIKLSAQLFMHCSFNSIQEIGARYRADQCLLVSYNITIWHPSACLGFWPLNYKQGEFHAEIILLDTRTGFVLLDKMYFLSKKSSDTSLISDREKDVIFGIISEWTKLVSGDILDFYGSEIE